MELLGVVEQAEKQKRILVVEDENIVALDIQQSLERLGHQVVHVVHTGEEALQAAAFHEPDLILMDIRLRGKLDGIQTAEAIQKTLDIPVIYLTAYADPDTLARAKVTEAYGYLLKPFEDRELHTTIEVAVYKHAMERRLRQQQRWLEITLRSIGDGVIATDSQGAIQFVNPVAEKLTGRRREQIVDQPLAQTLHLTRDKEGVQPVDVHRLLGPAEASVSLGLVWLHPPSGPSVPVEGSVAPLLEEGRRLGVVVVFRDVSKQQAAEQALRRSEERYRDLFEQAQNALLQSAFYNDISRALISAVNVEEVHQALVDGVASGVSASHVFLHIVNPKNHAVLGSVSSRSRSAPGQYPEVSPDVFWPAFVQAVARERHPKFLHPQPPDKARPALHRRRSELPGPTMPNPFQEHPLGHLFNGVISLPLLHRREVLGVLTAVSIVDETQLTEKDMELMMVVANQAAVSIQNARLLEEAERRAQQLSNINAELEQFAYVVSHDLQEPLRNIRGYIELLAKRLSGVDREADEFIGYVWEGAERMSQLIQDLLTYARLGQRPLRRSQIRSDEVLQHVLMDLSAMLKATDGVVTYDPLPTLSVDPGQFRQLLQNLISNGLKFRRSEPPHVHISAQRQGRCWLFSVTDNGLGIPEEYTEEIFLVFRRLHTQREFPGTGIGLSICRKIVEAHGGRIWCTSAVGEGSTFYFTICEA